MALFYAVLDEIEKNLPYQQIYIDKSRNVINEEEDDERKQDVLALAKMMIRNVMKINPNQSVEDVVNRLMTSEPFIKYPSMKKALLESWDDE